MWHSIVFAVLVPETACRLGACGRTLVRSSFFERTALSRSLTGVDGKNRVWNAWMVLRLLCAVVFGQWRMCASLTLCLSVSSLPYRVDDYIERVPLLPFHPS